MVSAHVPSRFKGAIPPASHLSFCISLRPSDKGVPSTLPNSVLMGKDTLVTRATGVLFIHRSFNQGVGLIEGTLGCRLVPRGCGSYRRYIGVLPGSPRVWVL